MHLVSYQNISKPIVSYARISFLVFNRCFEPQGNGAIVNIVCDMFRGFPMMSHTGAARAAVENITR